MHINLAELEDRLNDYIKSSKFKTNKSAVIRQALEEFLNRKEDEKKLGEKTKKALETRFDIPNWVTLRGFSLLLYILSKVAPNASVKRTWPIFYKDSDDTVTNIELLTHIKKEVSGENG